MSGYSRGDVVLVGFVFFGESGKKSRPALVLGFPAHHRERQDVVVAAITSNIRRRLFGDHVIADWKGAGLLFPSLLAGILRTIRRSMIDRKLGAMPKTNMEAMRRDLCRSLGL